MALTKTSPVATPIPLHAPRLRGATTVLAGLVAVAAVSTYVVRPPMELSSSRAPDGFSSARAGAIVTRVATTPRVMGSANHARAREILIDELEAVGLTPQEQNVAGSRQWGTRALAARVRNVVGRLPGTQSTGAILLTAHYDTVELSPGAADDGAGVATVIETVRALRAGPALRNDLIVLLSDGEEAGLLGASAFAARHAWARDVRVVLNFEARGSSGPVLMFETSDRNGWLIREFGQSGAPVFATSVMGDIYRRMGANVTDLTIYRDAGMQGLNFAFIADPRHYHSSTDTPSQLSPATLQQMGDSALRLTRHFGDADLRQAGPAPNAIYFNPWGTLLVWYSPTVAMVLLVLSAAWLAWLMIRSWSRELNVRGLAYGLIGAISTLLLPVIVIFLLRSGLNAMVRGHAASSDFTTALIVGGVVFALLALVLTIWRPIVRRTGAHAASAAVLVTTLVLCVIFLRLLPGATYLLQWPILAGLLAHLSPSWRYGRPLTAIGGLVAVLVWAPLTSLLWTYFGLSLPFFLALAIVVPIITAFAVLPLTELLLVRAVPVSLAVGAVVCLTLGTGLAARGRVPPQPRNSLSYALNGDSGRAAWVSTDPAPDAWTSQFLTARPERGPVAEFTAGDPGVRLHAPAPVVPVDLPRAELLADMPRDDGDRSIQVRVSSNRAAPELILGFASAVKRVTVDGQTFEFRSDRPDQPARLRLVGYSGGADLEIVGRGQIEFWLADRTTGLPAIPGRGAISRPAGFLPRDAESLWCVRRYGF